VSVPAGKQALTLVVPLRAEGAPAFVSDIEAHAPALRSRLTRVQSLHFARVTLLDADPANGHARTLLLVATTFDGAAEAHLDELWQHAGSELELVLAQTEGWVTPGTRESFGRYVKRHARPAAASFVAHDTRSVPSIRADGELRAALSRWLTECESELRTLPALEVARLAQARLAPSGAGSARVEARSSLETSLAATLSLGDWLGLAGAALRSFVHDLGDWVAALWHDTVESGRSAPALELTELGTVRSFSHAALLKPGRFRRAALRFGLRVLCKLSRAATTSGKVAGLETVHAARFMLLEDGRLLFFADFAEGVDVAFARLAERASGLLGMIWSHTCGFPASFGFWWGGARDGARLQAWARGGELRTPLCYSAYPELGTLDVHENAEIRGLLASTLDETRARRLLSLVRD
jgi:hypothetical protein